VLTMRPPSKTPAILPTPSDGSALSPDVELRDVYLVNSSTGKARHLATLTSQSGTETNPLDLVWTRDGQEVWVRSLQAAVNVRDGSISPLLYNLGSAVSQNVQSSLLFPDVPPGLNPVLPGQGASWVSEYLVSPDGRYVTPNPYFGYNQGLPGVSVSSTGNEKQVVHGTLLKEPVYSLAWTRDSQNLVGGSLTYQPGLVSRVNALTGESEALVDDVFWIGVNSNLQARSLAQAPESDVTVVPADPAADWPCQTLGDTLYCIRLPPGWNAIVDPYGYCQRCLAIDNIVFPAQIGWTSLKRGRVLIMTDTFEGDWPKTPEEMMQKLPLAYRGNPWEPVTVDGVTGIHFLSGFGSNRTFYIFPTPTGYFQLYFFLGLDGGYQNPVIQKILQSIRW
jgi:hypothetical protein